VFPSVLDAFCSKIYVVVRIFLFLAVIGAVSVIASFKQQTSIHKLVKHKEMFYKQGIYNEYLISSQILCYIKHKEMFLNAIDFPAECTVGWFGRLSSRLLLS